MRTLGLVVCAQQRTSPRRLCSAARPFSAARALRAHQECGQRARAGVLRPGSSAEHTAQGCGAPRAHGQQTAPAGQRTYGGAARRGTARARVRRAAAAAWAALSPHPAPLQVRARTAGADRRRARRACAAGPVHASREGAAAREQRSTGLGYAHAGVTRACRVWRAAKGRRKRRLGSGVNRAQREKGRSCV
jgi:hypothetical protein